MRLQALCAADHAYRTAPIGSGRPAAPAEAASRAAAARRGPGSAVPPGPGGPREGADPWAALATALEAIAEFGGRAPDATAAREEPGTPFAQRIPARPRAPRKSPPRQAPLLVTPDTPAVTSCSLESLAMLPAAVPLPSGPDRSPVTPPPPAPPALPSTPPTSLRVTPSRPGGKKRGGRPPCRVAGCPNPAMYGAKNARGAETCAGHREEGSVDKRRRVCEFEDCTRNVDGRKGGGRCPEHRGK
ncbi:hypothetical protein DFJ74DRAFT_707332 [Hyaloraphidium curvatum]|nr:hypothetical protein DFJ74DRAFT_707332 [Hyaloraphidium curvatum]